MTEPSDSSRGRDVIDGGDGHRQRTESTAVHVQRFATGYNVVRVGGELSGDQGPTLLRVVAEELKRTPAHLALDLRNVEHIDDAGTDALLSAAALAADSDTSFCLVAAETGTVPAALAATHARHWFEIFASVQDAWDHSR
jgi:anti-anti-sigma factor